MTNRAQRRAIFKIKPKTYVIDAHLTGDLKGAHIVMGSMTGQDVIRLQSGEMNEGDAIQLAASKIVEHNLDTDDPMSLDLAVLLQISEAWRSAIKDAAVPPTSASD